MKKFRVYLDVNVIIDNLLGRGKFYRDCSHLLTLATMGDIDVFAPPNTFIYSFFVINKIQKNPSATRHSLALLRKTVYCVPVDGALVDRAISRTTPADLEDAYQIEVAVAAKVDYLITSDRKGFRDCPIPVMNPKEFVDMYYEV